MDRLWGQFEKSYDKRHRSDYRYCKGNLLREEKGPHSNRKEGRTQGNNDRTSHEGPEAG